MKFTFAPESRPLDGFTIKRAIYRGGFGEVYYAVSDAGREVAMKLLQNNAEIEIRGVQQCLNLSHPNLVTIFDIKKDNDGDQWIIMEFVSGETLDQLMRKHPDGVPIEVIRKWLPGIAAGVTYLHSCGIVHRDLKPANIFSEAGVVKIGDVGLSKFIAPSRRSAQTQSVGTVYYMAPEVAKGRYGREVDTYALGVILYEMLTGKLPFDGESTGEILMKHLSEEPDLTKLPPRLRGVIAKALHKDPQQRHKSIAELERVFTDAVLGRAQPIDILEEVVVQPNKEKSKIEFDEPIQVSLADDNQRVEETERVLKLSHRGFIAIACFTIGLTIWGLLGGGIARLELIIVTGTIIGAYAVWHVLAANARKGVHSQNSLAKPPPLPLRMSRQAGLTNKHGSLWSSMFLAVPFAALLTGGFVLFKPTFFESVYAANSLDLSAVAFFASVSVLGSWAVLSVSQLGSYFGERWKESKIGYAFAGAGVGIVAYLLNQFLLFDMFVPTSSINNAMFFEIGDHKLLTEQGPSLIGYMAFFSGLFGVRNWFSQVQTHREKRFSVWAVLWSIIVAWFATTVFAFPTAWAIAWAVIISCVVQLASPWESSPHRRRLAGRS